MKTSNSRHKYVLSIGSNHNREINMMLAEKELTQLFGNISFSTQKLTSPVGMSNNLLFANRVALFWSDMILDEVKLILKQIEQSAGRSKESKSVGLIPLDLDVVIYDDGVVKEDDLRRDYMVDMLKEIEFEKE